MPEPGGGRVEVCCGWWPLQRLRFASGDSEPSFSSGVYCLEAAALIRRPTVSARGLRAGWEFKFRPFMAGRYLETGVAGGPLRCCNAGVSEADPGALVVRGDMVEMFLPPHLWQRLLSPSESLLSDMLPRRSPRLGR